VKLGDLVIYDPDRYDKQPPNMGVVIKLYHCPPENVPGGPDREMVDVMWDNGVWTDDSYEFVVVQ